MYAHTHMDPETLHALGRQLAQMHLRKGGRGGELDDHDRICASAGLRVRSDMQSTALMRALREQHEGLVGEVEVERASDLVGVVVDMKIGGGIVIGGDVQGGVDIGKG